MDSFLERFFPSVYAKQQADSSTSQYCKFDSELLTLFTSSLYVAALIASFVASSVTRVSGRKWSMLIGGVTFLAGSALNGAAVNVLMLILGRVLLGIGIGFANQARPLFFFSPSVTFIHNRLIDTFPAGRPARSLFRSTSLRWRRPTSAARSTSASSS